MPSFTIDLVQGSHRLARFYDARFGREGDQLVSLTPHSCHIRGYEPIIMHLYEPETELLLGSAGVDITVGDVVPGGVLELKAGSLRVDFHHV